MSEAPSVPGSSRRGSYRPLTPDDDAAAPIAAPCGFDFIGRLSDVFAGPGGAASSVASSGEETAGKRICDRAVVLLRNPEAWQTTPDDDKGMAHIESAARLAADLHLRLEKVEDTLEFLNSRRGKRYAKHAEPAINRRMDRNTGYANVNYTGIVKEATLTIQKIEETLEAASVPLSTLSQEEAFFYRHHGVALNPNKTAENVVNIVVNKTVGVLPETVQESLKDAAEWFANLVRGNPVAKTAFKIIAALGMFLAYAVPIALIVASVIFPPIAPITATLAGGATVASPFISCFFGELWKALRDKAPGPDMGSMRDATLVMIGEH